MIRLFHGGFDQKEEILYTQFEFPAGEAQIRLPADFKNNEFNTYTILWNYASDAELMGVALLVDTLVEAVGAQLSVFLELPYLPYARQDRVCAPGEAFSLRAFAGLINSLDFDLVCVTDPHNIDVYSNLFENAIYMSQATACLEAIPEKLWDEVDVILFPDAGAAKKVHEYEHIIFDHALAVAQGSKMRDPVTGSLTGFDINVKDFRGKNVLIVDDICDGGGTFIGLGAVAKEKNCGKLYLYTTHGIYSKGLVSLNELFDGVFCYNNMF